MQKKNQPHRSCPIAFEPLENRTLLSASLAAAATKPPSPATKTTISVQAGTLGQAIAITVTVRDAASLGAPAGTVALSQGSTALSTLTLAPTTSSSAKFDLSTATFTIPAGAGAAGPFFGSHPISAVYTSTNSLTSSKANGKVVVKTPKFTKESGGLEQATVVAGSGAAIATGQTADMLYTGYLFKGGSIFDYSDAHGGTPFEFVVGAGTVITGFDEGTVGMQVGETRVLVIPPALGYGANGSPPTIPGNAKLVFLITLEGIG